LGSIRRLLGNPRRTGARCLCKGFAKKEVSEIDKKRKATKGGERGETDVLLEKSYSNIRRRREKSREPRRVGLGEEPLLGKCRIFLFTRDVLKN